GHPAARGRRRAVDIAELAGATWATGHGGTPWGRMVETPCRRLGGFDPDIRYRTNDAVVILALVAAGLAVTLLPELVGAAERPGATAHPTAGGSVHRTVFAATRVADAHRPSVGALLGAVRAVAGELP
ncbi:MAG TPA: LysR substrate-binding domain-containing protein, partial [Solirubrobacteraceae bacterium]|nr:LysR substrate-binding domain-containing protein [Solirubrobacteraceae bacterium]